MSAPASSSSQETPASEKARGALEAHTNACYWCKFHPFALCGTGQQLLAAIPLRAVPATGRERVDAT